MSAHLGNELELIEFLKTIDTPTVANAIETLDVCSHSEGFPSLNLRCLFPELPAADDLPTCQQAGILGPVVGAVGLAAASEALHVIEGRAPELVNRLAILDGTRMRWRTVELRPNPRCPSCAAAHPPPARSA